MATRILIALIVLGIIDVLIPVPIVGLILIYVILQKPIWFREMVKTIYHEEIKRE